MNEMMKMRKRILSAAAVFLMSAACTFLFRAIPASASETETEDAAYLPQAGADDAAAVIIHTNDVHCGYEDNIGYDGLALYKKELEQRYDNVLLVDCGDAIQGTSLGVISKGEALIRMMNHVGYDLATLGNHEFDFGMEALDDCMELFEGDYICANFCTADGKPVYSPWKILDAGGLKIGFLGVVTPDTYTKTNIRNILDESGRPMYDFLVDGTGEKLRSALQGYVDEMHSEGADIVILISHLGNSSGVTEHFRTENVIAGLSGIDAVLDGHSHEIYSMTLKDRDGRDVIVAQTGTKFQNIGQLTIYRDGHMEESLVEEVPKPDGIPAESVQRKDKERYVDPDTHAFLEETAAAWMRELDRKIGEAPFDLLIKEGEDYSVSRARENALCELGADAYREIGGADIGFATAGSFRNNIPKGDITFSSMLSLLPYSNEILTVSLSGRTLKDVLEYASAKLPEASARFPQVSGVTFTVDLSRESNVRLDDTGDFAYVDGAYRVSDIMVGGKPLDLSAEYTMAVCDFVLNGGDGFSMFREADVLSDTMKVDNMAVRDYIVTSLGGVIPDMYRAPLGRINIIG